MPKKNWHEYFPETIMPVTWHINFHANYFGQDHLLFIIRRVFARARFVYSVVRTSIGWHTNFPETIVPTPGKSTRIYICKRHGKPIPFSKLLPYDLSTVDRRPGGTK